PQAAAAESTRPIIHERARIATSPPPTVHRRSRKRNRSVRWTFATKARYALGPMSSCGHWAVILGVSAGTGAAIARAVSRDLGLSVFGVHRGRHQADADALAREVSDLGQRAVFSVGDAGTSDSAASGAAALLDAAGPRSVRLFVHSLASASLGYLASGDA